MLAVLFIAWQSSKPFDINKTKKKMKLYLSRVKLVRGYANKGRDYFGVGDPLYTYSFAEQVDYTSKEFDIWYREGGYFRAKNRNDAKEKLIKKFPNARFFR